MDEKLRYNLRHRWLFSLFEFAHFEFQKRLWLDAIYPDIIGDYTEAVCKYFNDLNIEYGYNNFIKEKIVTREEVAIITDFHNQLHAYVKRSNKRRLSDKNILKDMEWINLTNLAKTNWDKLKMIITDKNELEYMTKIEKQYLSK